MMQASIFRTGSAFGGSAISRRLCPNPIGSFRCTIRAFPAHAQELNNPEPASVHFFYKPYNAAYQLQNNGAVPIPTVFGDVVHEIEICLLMGKTPLPCPVANGGRFDPVAIKKSIGGIGLGLDWTIRSVQQSLAKEGLPWERSKSFTRSGAVTEFRDPEYDISSSSGATTGNVLLETAQPDKFPRYQFTLLKNGEAVQKGDTDMLSFCPLQQVWQMHRVTRLNEGDVIMTGTPAGVGSVELGDKLQLKCDELGIDVTSTVVDEATLPNA